MAPPCPKIGTLLSPFCSLSFADLLKYVYHSTVKYYSIVRNWQIFGHGSDFHTWSELSCLAKEPSHHNILGQK